MSDCKFILYGGMYQPVANLPNASFGKLMKAIFEYQISGTEIELEDDLKMAFLFFKNQFSLDKQKYEKIVETRREIGKKGGLAKASKSYQKLANLAKSSKAAYNENDNENISDCSVSSENGHLQEISLYGGFPHSGEIPSPVPPSPPAAPPAPEILEPPKEDDPRIKIEDGHYVLKDGRWMKLVAPGGPSPKTIYRSAEFFEHELRYLKFYWAITTIAIAIDAINKWSKAKNGRPFKGNMFKFIVPWLIRGDYKLINTGEVLDT